MLDTKEQKQIFDGSIVLIIILGIISLWSRPAFKYQDNRNFAASNQNILNSKAYLDYLRAASIDQKASQQLMQTILTQDDIKNTVEEALQTNQPITPPVLDQNKIRVSNNNSDKAINDYLSASVSLAYTFTTSTANTAQGLFSGSPDAANQIQPRLEAAVNNLYALPVPGEALAAHKALLNSLLAYDELLSSAKVFNTDYTQDDAVWPVAYKDYALINDNAKTYSQELTKIAARHKLSSIPVFLAQTSPGLSLSDLLIPKAQAFLGIGDIVSNFTIGDVSALILDGLKQGIKTAFLQFTGAMLQKFVTKIEQNYVISNFLYYTDALVNGQYADDYLNKYVSDQLDRQIVKKLLPQLNCGKAPDLNNVYSAQATQYLGFDPASLDPSDPNFYQKLDSVGNFYASPNGWQIYYEGLASQTESAAQKAADEELSSSGLKTPRDTISNSISISINDIVSGEAAAFNAIFNLGISNSDSVISSIVASLTQTLINRFVFQGVTNNNGKIAVFKEQSTCVAAAVLSPVLPLPSTDYPAATPPPTQQAATAQSCSGLNTLGGDCTVAVIAELGICANNPGQHTGYQSCIDLAHSTYVQMLLNQCVQEPRPTADCVNLQNYVSGIH